MKVPMARIFLALTALVLLLAAVPARAADVVFPGISRIGVVPPEKMTPSRRMSGFEDEENGASIIFSELPKEAYGEVVSGFTDDALKSTGLTVVKRGQLEGFSQKHTLLTAEQTAANTVFRRYILVTEAGDMTALTTVQIPRTSKLYPDAQIRRMLASTAIRPPLSVEQQLAGLPFSLAQQSGFRFLRTLAGNAVLLTEGPKDTFTGIEQPSVIVATSLGPAFSPEEKETLGRRAIVTLPELRDVRIDVDKMIRQESGDIAETTGTARTADTGELVAVFQSIRFTPTGYVRMVGRARLDQQDAMLVRFRAIRDGIGTK